MVTDAPQRTDSTPLLVRMVAVHVGVLALAAFVVVFLVAFLVLQSWLAVPLAGVLGLAVGAGVTAWRMRDLDARIAARIGAEAVSVAEFPRLVSVAESVAMAAGIPDANLYVIRTAAPNAITWGAGDGPPSIACTTGLLDALDRVQLESVLAHQSTLANDRPIDVITLGAHLFGPVAVGPLAGPVAAFIHTSTDPRSIVLADLEGSRATRYPPGMVSALETLLGTNTLVPSIPQAFSNLCLVTPVHEPNPFALHPPLEDRIDLLREI